MRDFAARPGVIMLLLLGIGKYGETECGVATFYSLLLHNFCCCILASVTIL
jgi:hypothetical protein